MVAVPEPSTLALLLVAVAVVLFISNLLRHDVIALILLISTALLGLVRHPSCSPVLVILRSSPWPRC
jgi:hypothetical protein